MAKRFTATEKWDDPFFFELTSEFKLCWIYLLDKCDNAGVYDVNLKTLNFFCGTAITEEQIIEAFGDRIQKLNGGSKWFIHKFIDFQYGQLTESCNPHKPVIEKLKKYGLYKNKGTLRVLDTLEEKEKEHDIDIDIDKEKEKSLESEFEKFWTLYNKKTGKEKCKKKFLELSKDEIKIIFDHVPKYVKSTPDPQYRKDPITYLNNKSWNDEIIIFKNNNGTDKLFTYNEMLEYLNKNGLLGQGRSGTDLFESTKVDGQTFWKKKIYDDLPV